MAEFLFAYGTMLHNPLDEQAQIAMDRYTQRVDYGWVLGRLYDFGDYPGAVPPGWKRGRRVQEDDDEQTQEADDDGQQEDEGEDEEEAPSGRVHGQILRIIDSRRFFRVMDEYEELDFQMPHSGEFRREKVDAHPRSRPSRPIECWIYWVNRVGSSAPVIASGDWVEYVTKRRRRRRR